MRTASQWEPRVGVDFATSEDGSPVPPPRFKRKEKRAPGGGGGAARSRDRIEQSMMESKMDTVSAPGVVESGLLGHGAPGGEEVEGDDADFSGSPTRNDNVNALNGVAPYYAMPQEVLPVFFEPTPTAAMIAAKKSFLSRQGWEMATIGAK